MRKRKVVDPFYQSRAWYRIRTKVLIRDKYTCVNCGVSVRGKGMARVDHIRPRKYYPELALHIRNLRLICVLCDNARHSRDRAGAHGLEADPIGLDGFPIDSDWS